MSISMFHFYYCPHQSTAACDWQIATMGHPPVSQIQAGRRRKNVFPPKSVVQKKCSSSFKKPKMKATAAPNSEALADSEVGTALKLPLDVKGAAFLCARLSNSHLHIFFSTGPDSPCPRQGTRSTHVEGTSVFLAHIWRYRSCDLI